MLTDFVHVPTHSNSMLEAFTKGPQMLLPPSLLLLLFYKKKKKKTCIVKITKLSCLSLAASKLRLRIFYKLMSVLEHYVFLYFPKTLPIFFCPLIFLSSSFCFFLGCKYTEFARIQKNFQGAKNNLQGFFGSIARFARQDISFKQFKSEQSE